ncbi:Oxidoreductase [Cryptotrichosporon argae]
MFRPSLRPAAQSLRARAFSSRPAPSAAAPAASARAAAIAATALAVGTLYASQRRVENASSPLTPPASPRESVIDQPTLKANLHKRSAVEAPTTIKESAKEATEPTDAANQGAFNPETGEINWDCPCLGGMADGPCGEDFKAAFSCFVYSEAEPKGLDCIEKFKAMQACFRLHPDIYAEEIDADDSGPAGSPLPEGHPDRADVPPPPTRIPPVNNATFHTDTEDSVKSPRKHA